MDRFEGIPGYKVVAKLDYIKSREIIGNLMTFTDEWHVFDEFIYRGVERSKVSELTHDWCSDYDGAYPRYTITSHYETASIIKATNFVRAASDRRGKLRFVHIEPARIYPHLIVR